MLVVPDDQPPALAHTFLESTVRALAHKVEWYFNTLGVVGTGAIGQGMIQLGKGIGINVIAWTLHLTPECAAEYGIEFLPSLKETRSMWSQWVVADRGLAGR